MKKEIQWKAYRIVLYVFAFVLPFSTPRLYNTELSHSYFNITPALLALFLLIWLIEGDFKAKFQRIGNNKLWFPFCAATGLYLLYVVGLLYSSNLDFGRKDILLKLPLLLFPLLIFTLNPKVWKDKIVQNLLFTFALGSLATLLISLVNSFVRGGGTFIFENFHYQYASFFCHPSYASMYYCLSLMIILYLMHNRQLNLWKKITAGLMIVLFPLEIVLLDSRTGQLTLVAAVITYILYLFLCSHTKKNRFFAYTCLFAIGFCIVCGVLFMKSFRWNSTIQTVKEDILIFEQENENGKAASRIQKMTEDVEAGKIDARIQAWVSAVKISKEQPVLGVGTGDIKDALQQKYIQNDYRIAKEHRLNAHNQYLQVAATLGLVGLVIFLTFLFSIFWIGWKNRNIIILLFGLIGIINFCTESMFERQIGVMFFAFFFSLLCYAVPANLLKKRTLNECENNG